MLGARDGKKVSVNLIDHHITSSASPTWTQFPAAAKHRHNDDPLESKNPSTPCFSAVLAHHATTHHHQQQQHRHSSLGCVSLNSPTPPPPVVARTNGGRSKTCARYVGAIRSRHDSRDQGQLTHCICRGCSRGTCGQYSSRGV